jgi:hypothetical protein
MDGLCPECQGLEFTVKVESYRKQPLEHCTVHYWLMNAEAKGWELDNYMRTSEEYNFICSLPTEDQTAQILESRTH